MVQQILDPNGTLQHVILTTDPMLSQQPPPPPQSHHGVPITPYVSIFIQIAQKTRTIFFCCRAARRGGEETGDYFHYQLQNRSQRWSQRWIYIVRNF